MSRNNTGNPIGSKAFADFEDNVKNLDEAVNTADPQWVDRFGRFRLPLMEQERQFVSDQERREGEFQADQSSREAVFSDFLQASGYQDLGEYAPGIEITAHNQYVTFGGQPYLLKPSIPVPYTTSGEWTGDDFKLIGDAVLRQDLANPDKGAAMVSYGPESVASELDGIRGGAYQKVGGGYSLWTPPEMDNMRDDLPDPIYNGFGLDPELAYSELWDTLVAGEPSWITKSLLGMDESGTYPIYLYDFKPEQYDKTIIITCNLHGGERLGQYATWFFFRHMLNEWRESAQFAYARHGVRWLVVPIANPWGYKNNTRGNSNTVNLNRNADYLWNKYPDTGHGSHDYKGTAPWSEAESRYIRDLITDNRENTTAYLDIHNFGSTGDAGHFPIYLTGDGANGWDVFGKAIDAMNDGSHSVSANRSYNPSLYNWAHKQYGMYTANPEFDPGYYGPLFGPVCNTAATRYFGNLLLVSAQTKMKGARHGRSEPRAGIAVWSQTTGDGVTVSATSYAEIETFRVVLPEIPSFGFIRVTGTVTWRAAAPTRLILCPRVGQNNQGQAGDADSFGQGGYWQIRANADLGEFISSVQNSEDRVTVPFNIIFPVSPTMVANNGASPGPVSIGMNAYVSSGAAEIMRYTANWDFIPSSMGDEQVVVHSATGRDGMGAGAMQQTVPFRST